MRKMLLVLIAASSALGVSTQAQAFTSTMYINGAACCVGTGCTVSNGKYTCTSDNGGKCCPITRMRSDPASGSKIIRGAEAVPNAGAKIIPKQEPKVIPKQ